MIGIVRIMLIGASDKRVHRSVSLPEVISSF